MAQPPGGTAGSSTNITTTTTTTTTTANSSAAIPLLPPPQLPLLPQQSQEAQLPSTAGVPLTGAVKPTPTAVANDPAPLLLPLPTPATAVEQLPPRPATPGGDNILNTASTIKGDVSVSSVLSTSGGGGGGDREIVQGCGDDTGTPGVDPRPLSNDAPEAADGVPGSGHLKHGISASVSQRDLQQYDSNEPELSGQGSPATVQRNRDDDSCYAGAGMFIRAGGVAASSELASPANSLGTESLVTPDTTPEPNGSPRGPLLDGGGGGPPVPAVQHFDPAIPGSASSVVPIASGLGVNNSDVQQHHHHHHPHRRPHTQPATLPHPPPAGPAAALIHHHSLNTYDRYMQTTPMASMPPPYMTTAAPGYPAAAYYTGPQPTLFLVSGPPPPPSAFSSMQTPPPHPAHAFPGHHLPHPAHQQSIHPALGPPPPHPNVAFQHHLSTHTHPLESVHPLPYDFSVPPPNFGYVPITPHPHQVPAQLVGAPPPMFGHHPHQFGPAPLPAATMYKLASPACERVNGADVGLMLPMEGSAPSSPAVPMLNGPGLALHQQQQQQFGGDPGVVPSMTPTSLPDQILLPPSADQSLSQETRNDESRPVELGCGPDSGIQSAADVAAVQAEDSANVDSIVINNHDGASDIAGMMEKIDIAKASSDQGDQRQDGSVAPFVIAAAEATGEPSDTCDDTKPSADFATSSKDWCDDCEPDDLKQADDTASIDDPSLSSTTIEDSSLGDFRRPKGVVSCSPVGTSLPPPHGSASGKDRNRHRQHTQFRRDGSPPSDGGSHFILDDGGDSSGQFRAGHGIEPRSVPRYGGGGYQHQQRYSINHHRERHDPRNNSYRPKSRDLASGQEHHHPYNRFDHQANQSDGRRSTTPDNRRFRGHSGSYEASGCRTAPCSGPIFNSQQQRVVCEETGNNRRYTDYAHNSSGGNSSYSRSRRPHYENTDVPTTVPSRDSSAGRSSAGGCSRDFNGNNYGTHPRHRYYHSPRREDYNNYRASPPHHQQAQHQQHQQQYQQCGSRRYDGSLRRGGSSSYRATSGSGNGGLWRGGGVEDERRFANHGSGRDDVAKAVGGRGGNQSSVVPNARKPPLPVRQDSSSSAAASVQFQCDLSLQSNSLPERHNLIVEGVDSGAHPADVAAFSSTRGGSGPVVVEGHVLTPAVNGHSDSSLQDATVSAVSSNKHITAPAGFAVEDDETATVIEFLGPSMIGINDDIGIDDRLLKSQQQHPQQHVLVSGGSVDASLVRANANVDRVNNNGSVINVLGEGSNCNSKASSIDAMPRDAHHNLR